MNNKKGLNLFEEINRMLKISNFGMKSSKLNTDNTSKKVVKENMDDIASEFEDVFGAGSNNSGVETSGPKSILTIDMKAAMLCHSLSEFTAIEMGLITNYTPYTKGSSQNDKEGTLIHKPSVAKTTTAGSEIERLKRMFQGDDVMKHTPHANWDHEWNKILRSRRVPVVFVPEYTDETGNIIKNNFKSRPMMPEEEKFFAKWWPEKGGKDDQKVISIISHANNSLTDTGKAQMEFLARVVTNNPIDSKETKLFSILNDNGRHYKTIARDMIMRFYRWALTGIIKRLIHGQEERNNSVNVDIAIEEGLIKAIDSLDAHYDPSKGNLGSYIITVVKNNVIDNIKKTTTQSLDLSKVDEFLYYNNPPYVIETTANPEDPRFRRNWSSYKQTPSGFDLVYDSPEALRDDLNHDARMGRIKGGKEEDSKVSPLAKVYLTQKTKQKFYTSIGPNPDEVNDTLGLKNVDPYETNMFKLDILPVDAKAQVNKVFDEIISLFVIGKPAGKDPNRVEKWANTPAAGKATAERAGFIKQNTDIIKELMFDVLNYGAMVEVYKKSFRPKNSNSVLAPGRPVEVFYDKKGVKHYTPDYQNRIPQINIDTEYVWSTEGVNAKDVKGQFEKMFMDKILPKYGVRKTQVGQKREDSTIEKFLRTPTAAGISMLQDITNKVLLGIQKFFIAKDADSQNPLVKQNKEQFNIILRNYSAAMMNSSIAAESKINNKNLLS